ncbi:MBL fold metallo-hydrolase [Brevibacillus fluminis]|uniref:MBL fold metallo-hydrolase n=1 Tax=Brevibacillus fluminis TaxID=511487 RepID=UPI003F8C3890
MAENEVLLRQITEYVWIYPHGKKSERIEPVVGAIITSNQTVLIDCGNSPGHARAIQRALNEIKAPPVSTIIYTHHHWDHTFGSCVFDAEVIACQLCAHEMEKMAEIPWGPKWLEREMRENPLMERSNQAKLLVVDDWSELQIVKPNRVFTDQLTLHVDDIPLQLQWVGGPHASDSITVEVVGQGVLFVADCFYPPPFHLRKPEDSVDWNMLNRLGKESIQWYVHGHGDPLLSDEVMQLCQQMGK